MSDTFIVGIIVVLAMVFSIYKVFIRPSCSCGKGCNSCSSTNEEQNTLQKKTSCTNRANCPSCNSGK